MERYLYLGKKVWKLNKLKPYCIKPFTEIINVKKVENLFEFEIKETGEIFQSPHSCNIIKKSRKNLKLLKKLDKKKDMIKRLTSEIEDIKNNIKTYED